MARYVALLRGINVGGKNAVPMPGLKAAFEDAGFVDVRTYIQSGNVGGKNAVPMTGLKAAFEDAGFEDVQTYIQSGNVVFSAPSTGQAELTRRIERMIRAAFDHYEASVVLRNRSQMRAVVEKAPNGFGSESATYRYDVIFLKAPLTARAVVDGVPTKEGVDRIWPGAGVVYFSRLTSRAAQSRLSRVVSMPIYQQMTIRNWNTTTKLLELLDAADR